jgi:hypothetical protein
VQTRRSTLDESHDVSGSQSRQFDSSIAESIREELTDEREIVNDRCPRQGTILSQIALISSEATACRSQTFRGSLWDRDDVSLLQKPNQLRQGCSFNTSTTPCSRPLSQKWLCMFNRHIVQLDTLLPEPSAKECADPCFISD